jgi:hypothetical protein
MLRIGNLRLGKGIALIRRKQLQVVGFGTMSFIRSVSDEVGGPDLSRPIFAPRLTLRDFGMMSHGPEIDGYCGDPTCPCNDV